MKIAIIGYGKMGKEIERIARSEGHDIVLKITSQNAHELTPAFLSKADVAIDFSRPETAFENVSACLEAGLPVVSGTTAWLEKLDLAKAKCAAQKGAFFYASNFSIGVNIFFKLNRLLAKMMKNHLGYDVRMEEVHHLQKIDYPSGTAITLAEGILENLEQKNKWVAKLGTGQWLGDRESSEAIPILSKRENGVPGTHKISWASNIDSIEITHTAHSREGFAMGALEAAKWLIGRQGFFGMDDMLEI